MHRVGKLFQRGTRDQVVDMHQLLPGNTFPTSHWQGNNKLHATVSKAPVHISVNFVCWGVDFWLAEEGMAQVRQEPLPSVGQTGSTCREPRPMRRLRRIPSCSQSKQLSHADGRCIRGWVHGAHHQGSEYNKKSTRCSHRRLRCEAARHQLPSNDAVPICAPI